MIQMNFFTNQRVTDEEKKLTVLKGEIQGRINWETVIDIYTMPYIKWIIKTDCIAQGPLLNTLQ